MIERRLFVQILGGSVGSCLLSARYVMGASQAVTIGVSADLPLFMFRPDCIGREEAGCRRAEFRLASIAVSRDWPHCVLGFADGLTMHLSAHRSFNELFERTAARHLILEALRVKLALAWSLHWLHGYARGKMSFGDGRHINRIEADFLRLQEQDVLESATLAALHDLASELTLAAPIVGVTWDPSGERFAVARAEPRNSGDTRTSSPPVRAELRLVIAEHLGVDPDRIGPESSLVDDLGADSLDIVELEMAIEEQLGISIPDEAAGRFTTVGDTASYLAEHAN